MAANLHQNHRQRMRERLKKEGLKNFADHELLEVLLYYAIPMKNTNDIAHSLLKEFGSLTEVINGNYLNVKEHFGIGENTAVFFSVISEIITRYNKEKWSQKRVMDSSETAGEYAVTLLAGEPMECFYVICLDARNRLICSVMTSRGSVSEARIYPRDIVEVVIRHKAQSVILAHNHPGGSHMPTNSDIDTTNLIIEALNAIDVIVADHIIVADNSFTSLADIGMINNNI